MSSNEAPTRLEKRIGFYSVETNKLSESLCDGIATRLVREVKEHNERYKLHVLQSKNIKFEEAIVRYTKSLKHNKLSRKVNFGLAEKMFQLCFFVTDPNEKEITGVIRNQRHVFKSGITEENVSLKIYWIFLNREKIHKSSVEVLPVRFSKHSVSRILYRIKPEKLLTCLVNLATILSPIYELLSISERNDVKSKEWWLYVPNTGGFLFGTYDGFIKLVTFVDSNKLKASQISEGEEMLKFIEESEKGFSSKVINFFEYQQSLSGTKVCSITTITN